MDDKTVMGCLQRYDCWQIGGGSLHSKSIYRQSFVPKKPLPKSEWEVGPSGSAPAPRVKLSWDPELAWVKGTGWGAYDGLYLQAASVLSTYKNRSGCLRQKPYEWPPKVGQLVNAKWKNGTRRLDSTGTLSPGDTVIVHGRARGGVKNPEGYKATILSVYDTTVDVRFEADNPSAWAGVKQDKLDKDWIVTSTTTNFQTDQEITAHWRNTQKMKSKGTSVATILEVNATTVNLRFQDGTIQNAIPKDWILQTGLTGWYKATVKAENPDGTYRVEYVVSKCWSQTNKCWLKTGPEGGTAGLVADNSIEDLRSLYHMTTRVGFKRESDPTRVLTIRSVDAAKCGQGPSRGIVWAVLGATDCIYYYNVIDSEHPPRGGWRWGSAFNSKRAGIKPGEVDPRVTVLGSWEADYMQTIRIREAMSAMNQAGGTVILQYIEDAKAFPPQLWEDTVGKFSEEQIKHLYKTLTDRVIELLSPDWDKWTKSSVQFLETWSFVKIALAVRSAWLQPSALDQLHAAAEKSSVKMGQKAEAMYVLVEK